MPPGAGDGCWWYQDVCVLYMDLSHLHVLVPLVQEVHALHVIRRGRSGWGLKVRMIKHQNAPQAAAAPAAVQQ